MAEHLVSKLKGWYLGDKLGTFSLIAGSLGVWLTSVVLRIL